MSSDGDEEDDGLAGVTFKVIADQARVRPKVLGGSTGSDLMEFSAPSRPAQAPRSDVSTPSKSAEGLLSKLVGSTTPKKTPVGGRKVLSVRDTNLATSIGEHHSSDGDEP